MVWLIWEMRRPLNRSLLRKQTRVHSNISLDLLLVRLVQIIPKSKNVVLFFFSLD